MRVPRLPLRDARSIHYRIGRLRKRRSCLDRTKTYVRYVREGASHGENEAIRTKIAAPLTPLLDNTYVPDAHDPRVVSPTHSHFVELIAELQSCRVPALTRREKKGSMRGECARRTDRARTVVPKLRGDFREIFIKLHTCENHLSLRRLYAFKLSYFNTIKQKVKKLKFKIIIN